MRGLWRNAAFRRELTAMVLLTVLFAAVGWIASPAAGLAALGLGVCAALAHVYFASRRYRTLGELANDIDRILHGESGVSLDRYSEGELSILQSELARLITALRQQSETLKGDKVYLADSLADISHQLKTPLTSINLAVAMLSAPELTDGRRLELTRDIQRQLGRIEWLVSALLKISRLDAGMAEMTMRDATVRELADAAASPLLIALELRDVALVYDFEGDEALRIDLSWTAEALGNILKNSMEHTPPGGSITVAARENAIYTELVIRDSGPGFDPEDLPHIFQRFYRGKNASENSAGIGLALARTVIRSQNGTVQADNDPRGGARFIVRFYKSTV